MPRWKHIDDIRVRDIRHLVVEEPVLVPPDLEIEGVLAATVRDPRTRHIYVVAPDSTLLGAIRMNVLVEHLFPLVALAAGSPERGALWARTANDLMNPNPRFVVESNTLGELGPIFMEERINELPVLDGNGRILGQVNMHEVISGFLRATSSSQEEG
jgi:CBS-domain-containing membrane protein